MELDHIKDKSADKYTSESLRVVTTSIKKILDLLKVDSHYLPSPPPLPPQFVKHLTCMRLFWRNVDVMETGHNVNRP